MKHTKRILSVLLTLCMLLSALPLTVIAEDCAHNYPYVCSTLCTLCGEVRTPEMEHDHYLSDCDETCSLCGEVRETTVPHESDGLPCVDNVCKHCYAAIPATADHTDEDGDYYCDACWTWLGCDQGVHSRDGLPCQDTVCYYCGIEMPAEDHETGSAPICVDNQCIYCGASVPATADHNYQCYYDQAPTCVNDGKQYYECTQCYDRYTETIPTTGEHEDSDGDYRCDWCVLWLGCESGVHDRIHTTLCVDSACSECGLAMPATEEHVSNNYACRDGWCVNGCNTVIPATADHTYAHVGGLEPTCTQDGYDAYECMVCGDTYEETYPATGWHAYPHQCSDSCMYCGQPNPDPGDHVSGAAYPCQDGECVLCGAFVPAGDHLPDGHPCMQWCGWCYEDLPSLDDHEYVNLIAEAPTCNQEGYYYYSCSVCADVYEEFPAATGEHTYDDATDPDCNVCGEPRDVETPDDCAHEYDYDCSTTCNLCGEEARPEAACLSDGGTVYGKTATIHGVAYYCQHCGDYLSDVVEEHYDNDGDGACDVCDYMPCEEHVYDSNFDWFCNVCDEYREVEAPVDIVGVSVSEDVDGLAMLFSAKVEGVTFDGNRIIYDNATIGGHKLIGLGAVVSNNYEEVGYAPSLEDVDGVRVMDVPAINAFDYDEATGTLYIAFRIINIPDEYKDRMLVFTPYFIFENNYGEQEAFQSTAWGDSYNNVATENVQ